MSRPLGSDLRSMLAADPELSRLSHDDLVARASIGFVNLAFRRTDAWESEHSKRTGLPDSEMMRVNAASTRLVLESFSTVDPSDASSMCSGKLIDLGWKLTDPGRALPDGRTLREYMASRTRRLRSDSNRFVDALLDVRKQLTARDCLKLICKMNSPRFGEHWWGTDTFARMAMDFDALVADPGNPWWVVGGESRSPVGNPFTRPIHEALIAGPDLLTAEEAAWCIGNCLGYVSGRDPAHAGHAFSGEVPAISQSKGNHEYQH